MPREALPLVVTRSLPAETGTHIPYGRNPDQNPADLPKMGRVLLRHRGLILLTVAVVMGSAWAVVSTVKPRYTAETLLMVGDQQTHDLNQRGPMQEANSDLTENEIEIVKSRRILQMVVVKLNLLRDPTINPTIGPDRWAFLRDWGNDIAGWATTLAKPVQPQLDWARGLIPNWGSGTAAAPVPSPESSAMSRTIDAMSRNMVVAAKGRSRVVSIDFTAQSPEIAAAVANATAEVYIQDQLDSRLKSTVEANKWLSAQVNQMRNAVVDTDRTVQQRRADAGITRGRQQDLINEQISALSDQLTLAGSERALAEARVNQGGLGRAGSETVVGGSPLLQRLQDDQAALHQKIAQAQQVMGDRNPVMLQLQAQQSANDAALRSESARASGAVRSNSAASRARDLAIARTREAALRKSLEDLKAQANKMDGINVDISAEQHEADADRTLFDHLLSQAKETSIESGLIKPDAHIVASADTPLRPSYPNKPVILLLAFVGAGLAAVLLVFARESFDQGFRDIAHVEETLGIPALGYLPRLKRGERPENYVLEHPFSAYSEAIRSLYTSLMLSDMDRPPKIVLIASSLPDEGKTATTIGLARLVARSGKRVLVIDGDLRKPSVHRAFGVNSKPGLIDHLAGKVAIEDVLIKDAESNALLLPSGTNAPNPTDVFTSDAMRKLLQTLVPKFDLILLDSAPLLAVSDTWNLCHLADKVLFVIRWHQTREAAAGPAIRQVLSAGGDIAGVILSMADLKQLKTYSGSVYYQHQIISYLNYTQE